MDLGLRHKTALVTGGTSGIGLSIASRLLAEGARVAICGRNPEKLESAVAELQCLGEVLGFSADVGQPADTDRLVTETAKALGGLAIVISNAGTHLKGAIDDLSSGQVEEHFRTKVLGAWNLARAARPHLAKAGGRFIVIIGQAGKVPGRGIIGSAVVNAAQHAFVKSLSDDFGPEGILVNAVCPSRIETPLTAGLTLDQEIYLGRSLEQQESRWGATVPLGRWGKPDDIAAAVAFLASDRAGYICGANIDVDGGYQRMIF